MVERGAAAEVGPLDERDRQAALSGVVGNGQAMNAAAHDEHVEGGAGQLLDIAMHESSGRVKPA